MESLKKVERLTVLDAENSDDIIQSIKQDGRGIIFFDLVSKQHLTDLVTVLTVLSPLVKRSLVKVFGITEFPQPPQIMAFLSKNGCNDVLDPRAATQKALVHKFNRYSEIVEKSWNKEQTLAKANESDKLIKKSVAKSQTTSLKPAEVKMQPPLEILSDFWLIASPAHIKRRLATWMINMIGPPPSVGKWQSLKIKNSDGSTEEAWQWTPRSNPDPFLQEDGAWIFKGKQPEFSWADYNWLFIAERPDFTFYYEGKPYCEKIQLKDNVLLVSQNTPRASEVLKKIQDLLGSDKTFESGGVVAAKDYTATKDEKIRAPMFNLDPALNAGSALTSHQIEMPDPSSGLSLELPPEAAPDIRAPDLAASNSDDWDEKLKDLQVSITLQPEQGPPYYNTRLMDWFEDELTLEARKSTESLPQDSPVSIHFKISGIDPVVNFSLKGRTAETEEVDQFYIVTIYLEEFDPTLLEKFIRVFAQRQKHTADFLKKAKGIV